MKKTRPDAKLLETLSLPDLCRFCHVEESWVFELVEYGALEPSGSESDQWFFQGVNISKAKKAARLMRDLGVNAAGIALAFELMEERDALMRRLAHMDPN